MTTIEIRNDDDRRAVLARITGLMRDPNADAALRDKEEATRRIVEAVRERGDAAVAEFTERFDGVSLSPAEFEVDSHELDRALAQLDAGLRRALERARDNIQRYHEKHLRASWEETLEDGTVLGQRITPIERVGVYVPGGKAFYPSSVLMNILPARVAGVGEIVMVSPPSFEGGIHPAVLAAARLAGATRVFQLGGAQSIAALAYGTDTVPSVLKITGPGNTFVTVAKRLVRTVCEIDTHAGPSEVGIVADDTASPAFAAAELLAQAEHDEEACTTLLTPSKALARAVLKEAERQLAALPRGNIMRKALDGQGTVIITRDLDEAAALASEIAPEHLTVYTRDPGAVFAKIHNAGAAFLGPMSSVAVGDYFAGPNHILPTGRRARFASPLTAEDFRKVTSIVSYSEARLRADADDIMLLAEAEGLTAHANAVRLRKESLPEEDAG